MVKTGQQSLKFLLEQNVGTPAQQKWLTKLLGYDFSIDYKKGRENRVADALFRRDELPENQEGRQAAITFPQPLWLEELKQSYLSDTVAQELLSKIQQGHLQGKQIVLRNGILVRKGRIYVGGT
ncbi:hypothetical protein CJ030_MR1G017495 [Morella rubra]|uniref:Reverse transcriptase RNase H-like domain-containing protein n=1 Tax=Morella rubra TaxID=262757 RepID=A0A6A1WRX8_9ROSI|nr:hypothetical protein CJ030_MR1G017495 [Morella rubra]